MMAKDLKYGKASLQYGSIGEDEPIFIFRAQDRLLLNILNYYYSLCAEEGSPPHHLEAIRESIRITTEWQHSNATRIPNSDEYHKRVTGGE
jgi:hypothetical protein